MGDLLGCFEGEPELLIGLLRPILHHLGTGPCVERAVNLHAVQMLRVMNEKLLALQVIRIESSLPAGIAEAGDSDMYVPNHFHSFLLSLTRAQ